MDKTKKELQAQFKERAIVGGVYAIRNTRSGTMLVKSAVNLQGSRNRFEFAQKTGSCIEHQLRDEWNRDGADAFRFEILEELAKGETQTDQAFHDDLAVLLEMWRASDPGELTAIPNIRKDKTT